MKEENKLNHSPAPWKFTRFEDGPISIKPLGIIDSDGKIVMAFGDSYLNDVTEPNPADAALIAAAPEMLEMLKGLSFLIEQSIKYNPFPAIKSPNEELFTSVTNLIAKAEGNVPAEKTE